MLVAVGRQFAITVVRKGNVANAVVDRTFNRVPRRPNDEIQTRYYFLRPGLAGVVCGHRNLRARRTHSH
jgi:hypothetical protein